MAPIKKQIQKTEKNWKGVRSIKKVFSKKIITAFHRIRRHRVECWEANAETSVFVAGGSRNTFAFAAEEEDERKSVRAIHLAIVEPWKR